MKPPVQRTATIKRKTSETDIHLELNIDGSGKSEVGTGIGFLDHLVRSLCLHARFDVSLECRGDLDVDDHHTVEDTASVLGTAIGEALGTRDNIERFGHAYAPLDDALARAVVDLARRPFARVDTGLRREYLGRMSAENISHFFSTMAASGRFCLHVDVLAGENDHHRAEAAFKATALAVRRAIRKNENDSPPSTKGSL